MTDTGSRLGFSTLAPDSDGVMRTQPYRQGGFKAFGVAAGEVAVGRSIPRPARRKLFVDYAGPAGTIRSYSFSDVVRHRVPPAAFRGKIVVMGPTAPSLQDVHAVPVGGPMSGTEIQANAAWTALRGFPLRPPPRAVDVLAILLLGVLVPLVSLRFGWITSVGTALVAAAGYLVVLQLAFDRDVVLSAVYPLLALAVTTAFVLGRRARRATSRRRRLARR